MVPGRPDYKETLAERRGEMNNWGGDGKGHLWPGEVKEGLHKDLGVYVGGGLVQHRQVGDGLLLPLVHVALEAHLHPQADHATCTSTAANDLSAHFPIRDMNPKQFNITDRFSGERGKEYGGQMTLLTP